MALRETPKADGEILECVFPAETRSEKFEKLKGHFLATYQLSQHILQEDPDILVFELDEIVQPIA